MVKESCPVSACSCYLSHRRRLEWIMQQEAIVFEVPKWSKTEVTRLPQVVRCVGGGGGEPSRCEGAERPTQSCSPAKWSQLPAHSCGWLILVDGSFLWMAHSCGRLILVDGSFLWTAHSCGRLILVDGSFLWTVPATSWHTTRTA